MVIEILIILYNADLQFMNYTGPVYSKSYSLRQFIVPDLRYEIPLKYLPLVFNRKPARFGG